jgi:mono/diheme cytochrome c family protein
MTATLLARIAPTPLGRTTALVVASVVYVWCGAAASQKQELHGAMPKADIKAGAETYGKYCGSCHGKQGKGDGPVAEALKIAPSDLTALTRTYDGKFPRGYVSAVLIFGKRVASHGSDDMPVWGAKFRKIDPERDRSGQKHIDDLIAYLESIQAK